MGESDEKARLHVVISGRVQGVFFRATTREQARRLGLTGWVKNRADGRVEAVFEGPRTDCSRMLSWCHKGPSGARVQNVQSEWQEPTGEFSGFRVAF